MSFPLEASTANTPAMSDLRKLAAEELRSRRDELRVQHEEFRKRGLKLDMTRGKPAPAQLDLARGLLDSLDADHIKSQDGTDVRNYGGLDGISEMKRLFSEILGVPTAQIVVGGNSSLQMMHDTVVRALMHGVPDGDAPWLRTQPKFICPAPGYDRHFSICQHLGIDMLVVDQHQDGPDVDSIERLVAADPSIKGLWCVPKYSNPTGVTCSVEVVERLASMKSAAPDFRLFWDNAYAVHDLYESGDELSDILSACERAGHPNRAVVFASTSKMSFAGAGVAAMASSLANVADAKKHLSFQTIGPDKLNQLRHARFFGTGDGLRAHMRKLAEVIRPKFDIVTRILDRELGGKEIAQWTKPRGGYFVSLDTLDGCASAVVRMADQAGVKLTPAGATFPYGKDPRDRNIRIAPTFPPLEQVELAMQVLAVCVELASVERLLQ